MGTLRYTPVAELAISLRDKFNLDTLIETGTYEGETTSWAAENFGRVVTIDILEEFQAKGKKRCEPYSNILFLLGDTRTALPSVVDALPEHPALFWLDAHNASGLFGRPGDDCPILEELDVVLSAGQGHLILIDDAHCFIPPAPHDRTVWPEIAAIQSQADKHGYCLRVAHDVIALVPESAKHMLDEFAPTNSANATINVHDPRLRRMFHFNLVPPKIICRATAITENPVVIVDLPAPISEIVDTAYGRMLIPVHDTSQTPALRQGYSLDHATFQIMIDELKLRPPGAVFLDIGANVGCFSLALASHCAKIHAFEPQRLIYNMLSGSVALNGWQHIYCYNLAISNEVGKIEVPQFDYTKPMSFGSIEFTSTQKERREQERQHDPDKVEHVQCVPLDFFNFPRVDIIKCDIEGMEIKFMRGAKETLLKHRPILFIEHGKIHGATLQQQLEVDFGYKVQNTGFDFYCLPKEN